jgi:hypothetical protein
MLAYWLTLIQAVPTTRNDVSLTASLYAKNLEKATVAGADPLIFRIGKAKPRNWDMPLGGV